MAPGPQSVPSPYFHEAIGHLRAGRLEQAGNLCLKHLSAAPDSAEGLHLLGVVRHQQGFHAEAVELITKAMAIKPGNADAYSDMGVALAALGRFDDAVVAYRQAIAIRPNFAPAHNNLGNALKNAGKLDEAVSAYRLAIAIKADFAAAHNNLGNALKNAGDFNDAIGAHRRAITIRPDYAEAHSALGSALSASGRLDEAVAAYRQAITIRPDYAEAHGGLSVCLLRMGDLRPGFEEYRWRWRVPKYAEEMPAVSAPLWEGESLSGKSILVHCEQGLGDCLQFIRYVRSLSGMAAQVRVFAPQTLVSLFQSIPDIEVLTFAKTYDGACDYHIPLMCLPRLFGTTLETVPADVPYLSPDSTKVERWSQRLSSYKGKIKVGLVWAGNPRIHDPDNNALDRRRSMTLDQFAPLAGIADVQYFSLQKGKPSEQAQIPPTGMELADLTSELHDFEDTGALVTNLDLVISVDTSVVHLAGALARPVWVLSRFDGCWRWLEEREDSPWYPTARIFRQTAPGGWDDVIARVRNELMNFNRSG